jgi:hypothetical protein
LAANVFIFAAFVDKHIGTLYSDLTSAFPFMSLEGNVCFLMVYHYESNTILVLPIANFTNAAILAAYQQQFEMHNSLKCLNQKGIRFVSMLWISKHAK